MLTHPLFITNFKNYESAIGSGAVHLAKIHERVARETGVSIGVCVSAFDIHRVSQEVSIPVFAQHVDPIDFGKFNGSLLPQAAKKAGAIGTLINHSERRLDKESLRNTISCAQKASLMRIVCAECTEEVEAFAEYDIDFLAFEPPELIGHTSRSVASEKPHSIADSVRAAGGIPVLVGAGINTPKDISVALDLGAKGFLVATAVVKSSDPEKSLRALVSAMIS